MQIQLSIGTQTKQCPGCNASQPLDDFYRDRRNADGLCRECKSCMKLRNAAYRESEEWKSVNAAARDRYSKRKSGELDPFTPKNSYQLPSKPKSTRAQRKRQGRRLTTKALLLAVRRHYGCRACGENEVACLDLHHIDPSDKLFSFGGGSAAGVSNTQLMQEITKCVVLCANCHRKIHAGIIDIDPQFRISISELDDIIRQL